MATRTPHSASLRFVRVDAGGNQTMQSFSRLNPNANLEQLQLIGTAVNAIRSNFDQVHVGQFTRMDELSV